jgi:DNA-binding NarL/FixJ family response regulator
VLTAFDDGEMPLQAMAAGADGFIGKDATHEEIAAAVLRVGDDGSSFEDLV